MNRRIAGLLAAVAITLAAAACSTTPSLSADDASLLAAPIVTNPVVTGSTTTVVSTTTSPSTATSTTSTTTTSSTATTTSATDNSNSNSPNSNVSAGNGVTTSTVTTTVTTSVPGTTPPAVTQTRTITQTTTATATTTVNHTVTKPAAAVTTTKDVPVTSDGADIPWCYRNVSDKFMGSSREIRQKGKVVAKLAWPSSPDYPVFWSPTAGLYLRTNGQAGDVNGSFNGNYPKYGWLQGLLPSGLKDGFKSSDGDAPWKEIGSSDDVNGFAVIQGDSVKAGVPLSTTLAQAKSTWKSFQSYLDHANDRLC